MPFFFEATGFWRRLRHVIFLHRLRGARICRGYPVVFDRPANVWNPSGIRENGSRSWVQSPFSDLARHFPAPPSGCGGYALAIRWSSTDRLNSGIPPGFARPDTGHKAIRPLRVWPANFPAPPPRFGRLRFANGTLRRLSDLARLRVQWYSEGIGFS